MRLSPLDSEAVRTEADVRITMRDGVVLRADVYHLVGASAPRAAILVRTPYGKRLLPSAQLEELRRFVAHGYTVVIQDIRGKHASDGVFRIGRGNRADGYDTLDWIAAQDWCDGSVGAWGCSYLGENQVYLATTGHPALKACIPMAAGAAMGTAGGRYARWGFRNPGGHLFLRTFAEWYARFATSQGRTDEDRVEAVLSLLEARETPPDALMARCGLPDAEWREIIGLDHQSPYWHGTDYLNEGEAITAPLLIIDSWFDPAIASGLALFDYVRGHGANETIKSESRLIVAPTCHCAMQKATEQTVVGDRVVGDARLDWSRLYLDWFDRWLRSSPKAPRPLATVYEIGANRWREESIWPIPAKASAHYIAPGGSLVDQASGEVGRLTLVTDPKSLVPTLGGTGFGLGKSGAVDQSSLFDRHDVAVFQSDPLVSDLSICGTSNVILYVSSAREDCDLFVTLLDLAPDGVAFNIQDGSLRGYCREGPAASPTPMESGVVYALDIEIGATFTRLSTGHRLGLMVSTTSYPNYPAPTVKNAITLHFGGEHPSRFEYSALRDLK